MNTDAIKDLRPEFRAFVDRAVRACDQAGDNAVLLLVGSYAAGFADRGSDLDLWIIGDRRALPAEQQREHDEEGGLFVDRGDYEAHWHLYDHEYLVQRLSEWPSEMMWILSTAKYLHGREQTFEDLRVRFAHFPRLVAEPKLKWLVGNYRGLLAPMYKVACQGRMADAWAIGGEAVDSLWKICCVAERMPWPYRKWLGKVARGTRVGAIVAAYVQRSVEAFLQFPRPAPGQRGPDWPPRKQLRMALDAMLPEFQAIGWQGDWLIDPMKACGETFKRPAP